MSSEADATFAHVVLWVSDRCSTLELQAHEYRCLFMRPDCDEIEVEADSDIASCARYAERLARDGLGLWEARRVHCEDERDLGS
jgi:hypothetical protein